MTAWSAFNAVMVEAVEALGPAARTAFGRMEEKPIGCLRGNQIRKFNLATPGRVEAPLEPSAEAVPVTAGAAVAGGAPAALAAAVGFVRALGGNRNLKLVDACTTRLRLEVVDDSLVNEPALRTLGARGIVRPSRNVLQVVIGPQAEIVAGEIREAMATGEYAAMGPAVEKPAVGGQPAPGPVSERMVEAGAED